MDDEVLPRLHALLSGRIASPPVATTLESDHKEAARRISEKDPPRDSATVAGPRIFHGDFLRWAELKRCVSRRAPFVMIVTNDVTKGDWVHQVRGLRVGARPELVHEMKSETGARLLLCTTSEFLAGGKEHLDADVSDQTLNEAQSLPPPGARQARTPRRYIPFESVPGLLRFPDDVLMAMANAEQLDIQEEDMWSWPELREVAVAIRVWQHTSSPIAVQMAVEALRERPVRRNQLVLMDDSAAWLKSTEVDRFVESLSESPVLVLDLRRVERTLRYRALDFVPELDEGEHGGS